MHPTIRQSLIQIIEDFRPLEVMVVGDLMLDQYTWGSVSRISPEAPIPILSVDKEEFRLGGAASVVSNVHALDCQVHPIGLVGQDQAGEKIIEFLKKKNISTEGVVQHQDFTTIVKKRVLTSQQQLLRIDYENEVTRDFHFEDELLGRIEAILPKVKSVILSDYAKGVLSPKLIRTLVEKARKLGIAVSCDPGKGVDFSLYQGVTTIKPNRTEAEQASGLPLKNREQILQAAEKIKQICGCDFLSLSLDKDGILLFRSQEDHKFVPTQVKEVFDVTGAGDIVISIIGILLGQGTDPELAVHMANVAAEREISHLGVVAVPWREILSHLRNDGVGQKIITAEQLKHEIWDRKKEPFLFTNGYFDQLSAGHLRFLLEIAKTPGRLVVAINSDRSIFRSKGSYPLLKEQDRARLLASLENVARIVIFDEDDASVLIQELKPDVIFKGEKFKDVFLPESDAIQQVGAEVRYIPLFQW